MDYLGLTGKSFLAFGVANKKSVAWHVGKSLKECGASVAYVVRNAERRESVAKLLAGSDIHVCDVEHPEQIERLREELAAKGTKFDGLLHSIGFADYSDGMKPFHDHPKPG